MWRDQIVAEIQKIRREHSARFNEDLDAMFRDWRKREQEGGREVISFQPRRIQPKPPTKEQPAA